MQSIHMSSKIATLGKAFFADVALIRPRPSVFSKVITYVARLFKDTQATWVITTEVKLIALCV